MKRLGAWLLPSVALATGVLGVDAVWVVASVASNRPCSWMALIAALDVAFMLRLANVRAGSGRIVLAVLATALAVLLAQWLIAATQMGLALGLEPLDSAMKLGPSLARQLIMLSLHRADFAWLVAALPLAALLATSSRREREAASAA